MANDVDEARQQLDKEFQGDRDYTPTPSLFKRLKNSYLLQGAVIIVIIACVVTLPALSLKRLAASDQKELDALQLPSCADPAWVVHGSSDGSSWVTMHRGEYTIDVSRAGNVWFNSDTKVIAGNSAATNFYNCALALQIARFRSLGK